MKKVVVLGLLLGLAVAAGALGDDWAGLPRLPRLQRAQEAPAGARTGDSRPWACLSLPCCATPGLAAACCAAPARVPPRQARGSTPPAPNSPPSPTAQGTACSPTITGYSSTFGKRDTTKLERWVSRLVQGRARVRV